MPTNYNRLMKTEQSSRPPPAGVRGGRIAAGPGWFQSVIFSKENDTSTRRKPGKLGERGRHPPSIDMVC